MLLEIPQRSGCGDYPPEDIEKWIEKWVSHEKFAILSISARFSPDMEFFNGRIFTQYAWAIHFISFSKRLIC